MSFAHTQGLVRDVVWENGKIIAKNLRNGNLEEKLSEIFSSKL